MHRLLRFFQPIGSALVTVALLDTIFNCFWCLLQYSNLEQRYFMGETGSYEFWRYLTWHFLIALRPLLSIMFWVGVIIWGKKLFLATWLLFAILDDASIMAYLIHEYIDKYSSPSTIPAHLMDNIWGIQTLSSETSLWISTGVYLIIRIYMFSVVIQGIVCLHCKYDHSRSRSISDNISDIDVCLEPIGSGWAEIISFYKDLPGMSVIILLTVEMIWNMEHLGVREMFAFMLNENGRSLLHLEIDPEVVDYVYIEDNILRCIRTFMAFTGICFVYREQLNLVRMWILVYVIMMVCSNVIFGLTVVVKSIHWIIFHAISIIFDILYRLLVLYFSCKFAIVHRRTIMKK